MQHRGDVIQAVLLVCDGLQARKHQTRLLLSTVSLHGELLCVPQRRQASAAREAARRVGLSELPAQAADFALGERLALHSLERQLHHARQRRMLLRQRPLLLQVMLVAVHKRTRARVPSSGPVLAWQSAVHADRAVGFVAARGGRGSAWRKGLEEQRLELVLQRPPHLQRAFEFGDVGSCVHQCQRLLHLGHRRQADD